MNKVYVIFPTILVIAFALYYTQVAKPEMAEDERIAAKKIQDQKDNEEARRLDIEKKAQADALAQQQERDRKDHERLERAKHDREEQDRKITEETEKFETEATSLTKQIADMDKETARLREQREELTREVYGAAAKVELAKIDRQNAELEIQRLYGMVAQKVNDSFLTQLPPPPAPK